MELYSFDITLKTMSTKCNSYHKKFYYFIILGTFLPMTSLHSPSVANVELEALISSNQIPVSFLSSLNNSAFKLITNIS